MKQSILILLLLGVSVSLARAQDNQDFQDKKQKTSYALGQYTGGYWKSQGLEAADLDADLFLEGFKAVLSGAEPRLDQQALNSTLRELSTELRARSEAKRKTLGEKNQKEGDAFLAENKSKPGVHTLPSGLQYEVLTEGSGPSPSANDTVTVNYRGTLIDGTEFDSSYKRNRPASFRVNGVIKGWTEALQLMKVGSKWQLFIPPNLAYGDRGTRNIPPNSVLIFEVELLSVQKPETTTTTTTPTQQPVTSDIIKVPSAEDLKKGAKIEIIKPDQIQQEIEKEKARQAEKK